MARIREYTSQEQAPGPINLPSPGASAFGASIAEQDAQRAQVLEQTGQRVSRLAGVLEEREVEKEQTTYSAKLAAVKAQFAKRHDELLRDPNSTEDSMKAFMADYNQTVSNLREGIQTRRADQWFEKAAAEQGASFQELADRGTIELNSAKDRKDLESELNDQSTALYTNPFDYQRAKSQVLDSISTRKYLTPEQRLHIEETAKKQLVESAIRGDINIDAVKARDRLLAGMWDTEISAHEKDTLLTHAHQVINLHRADQAYAEAQREKAQKLAQEATKRRFMNQIVAPGEYGKLNIKDITHSNLDSQGVEHMWGLLTAAANEDKIVENEPVKDALYVGIASGKITNTDPILQAVMLHQIKTSTARLLTQDLDGRTSTEGRTTALLRDKFIEEVAKPGITESNPVLNKLDIGGDQRLNAYREKLLLTEEQWRKDGKNIRDLYVRTSPDYMGREEMIKPFLSTKKDIIDKYMAAIRGVPETKPALSTSNSSSEPSALNPVPDTARGGQPPPRLPQSNQQQKQAQGKTLVRKQINRKLNKTRFFYSDNTSEIVDGIK